MTSALVTKIPYLPQLVAWLVLVLTGVSIMCYQIIDRVVYYYKWPTTVSVDVHFNESLTFPAITVCNQNSFRATAAAADQRYRLIEDIYHNHANISAQDITMDNLLSRASHRKEDMIVRCEWRDAPCSMDNFSRVTTDQGVCFTFNGHTTKNRLLKVTKAGIDYGLRLVLNVEQYEYMPGPRGTAGVKVLIQDQDEFPLVEDDGLAVPTGSHVFIANTFQTVDNLQPPHGECRTKDLQYFPNVTYTSTRCEMDCFTTKLRKQCGCRDAHLPHTNGLPPVCTLEQMNNCLRPFEKQLHNHADGVCWCPVPCSFRKYRSDMSYAKPSNFDIDKLLTYVATNDLQRKYLLARDTTERFEPDKFLSFKATAEVVLGRFLSIERLFEDINLRLTETRAAINTKESEIHAIWKRKRYILAYQLFMIQKNFIEGRRAMEERTLGYIGNGFIAFTLDITSKLRHLAYAVTLGDSERYFLYRYVQAKVDIEMQMITEGIGNLTQLVQAFETGTPIFRYRFHGLPDTTNSYVVPKILLNTSLYHTYDIRKRRVRLTDDLEILKIKLNGYKDLSETAYLNRSLNPLNLQALNEDVRSYYRDYFHSKSVLYRDCLEWSVSAMKTRLSGFTDLWLIFSFLGDSIHTNIAFSNESIAEMMRTVMPKLKEIAHLSQAYLNSSSMRKSDLAATVLSNDIAEGIISLKEFFVEIRTRVQAIYDDWRKRTDKAKEIWQAILTDADSHEYYVWAGYVEFRQNLSAVLRLEEDEFQLSTQKTDILENIGNKDADFFYTLENLMGDMSDFRSSTKLDRNFIRENFVILDVYFSEMSFEHAYQRADYEILALLCDIGGSLALFLGASALSLFEIVDLVINQAFSVDVRKKNALEH